MTILFAVNPNYCCGWGFDSVKAANLYYISLLIFFLTIHVYTKMCFMFKTCSCTHTHKHTCKLHLPNCHHQLWELLFNSPYLQQYYSIIISSSFSLHLTSQVYYRISININIVSLIQCYWQPFRSPSRFHTPHSNPPTVNCNCCMQMRIHIFFN